MNNLPLPKSKEREKEMVEWKNVLDSNDCQVADSDEWSMPEIDEKDIGTIEIDWTTNKGQKTIDAVGLFHSRDKDYNYLGLMWDGGTGMVFRFIRREDQLD